MKSNLALKGLTLCLGLIIPAAHGVEPVGGKDEEAKVISGKNFAEDMPLTGSANSAQLKKKEGPRGVELSVPKAKNPPVLPVPNMSQGGVLDDISRLNPTEIHSLLLPKSEQEIAAALKFARENGLHVSAAGAKHSQGGQIVYKGNVVLDMAHFDKMSLDKKNKVLTIQSGARWDDALHMLDDNGMSLDVIQTHVVFSVGGTLSVNAHGSNTNSGPVASTVKSLRIMLADGSIVEASREKNSELFHAALGGYGMVGIILDAKLQVRDNELYTVQGEMVATDEYPAYFAKNIRGNDRIKYLHALLSTAPSSFLKEIAVVKYMAADNPSGNLPRMDSALIENIKKRVVGSTFFLAKSGIGQELFWLLSGRLAPQYARLRPSARNQAMSEPLIAFKSNDPRETQLLHEYFLPPDRFPEFVNRLRESVLKHKATLTMAAARGVAADKDSMLPYAPEDRMALVLFFNQKIDPAENEKMAAMTRELIGAAIDLGGRFYLPYQLVYSDEQLRKAYPNIEKFFEVKRKYDPNEMFMNKWYAKYGKK